MNCNVLNVISIQMSLVFSVGIYGIGTKIEPYMRMAAIDRTTP